MWSTPVLVFGGIVAVVATAILVNSIRLYASLRGKRVVTCPETRQPVGVEINAARAARTMLIDDMELEIRACSRWPEKKECPQDCLAQIEGHPEDTLMRNILRAWYLDKDCVICGRPIRDIRWNDAIPALRAADGAYREWDGITAEELEELLKTSLAVCWYCDQAEQFRREFPGLVTDRAETPLRNMGSGL